VTLTDRWTRRAGLSASAELLFWICTVVYMTLDRWGLVPNLGGVSDRF